jgi:hypothetical protein
MFYLSNGDNNIILMLVNDGVRNVVIRDYRVESAILNKGISSAIINYLLF